jgi:hypothetical protein
MIYLISDDKYRDSIDLTCYFTDYERIEEYVEKYQYNMYGRKTRNIEVAFNTLTIYFEYLDFADEWESGIMYLHEINKYE